LIFFYLILVIIILIKMLLDDFLEELNTDIGYIKNPGKYCTNTEQTDSDADSDEDCYISTINLF